MSALNTSILKQTVAKNRSDLGFLLRADRTTQWVEEDLGTYNVLGETNDATHGTIDKALEGDDKALKDLRKAATRGPALEAGAVYDISVGDAKIDPGHFTSEVKPTDEQDGRTRLQVGVFKDGEVLEVLDYQPDKDGKMRLEPKKAHEGGRLGFIFVDTDTDNNDGRFDVNVTKGSARKVETDVAVYAEDADGVRKAGDELAKKFNATAPASADLPEPKTSLSGRGLIRADDKTLKTPDGYKFKVGENKLEVYWPGRDEPVTTFEGNKLKENDKTEAYEVKDGNFFLPNGAMFRAEFQKNGDFKNLTFAHGDTKVDVPGIDDYDGKTAKFGKLEDGGDHWRKNVIDENVDKKSYVLGGANSGWGEVDVTWHETEFGRNLGLAGDGEAKDLTDYYVDPELRGGEFGSKGYERRLRSQVKDLHAVISGELQYDGIDEKTADKLADKMLGDSGIYEEFADRLQLSKAHREGDLTSSSEIRAERLAQALGLDNLDELDEALLGKLLGGSTAEETGETALLKKFLRELGAYEEPQVNQAVLQQLMMAQLLGASGNGEALQMALLQQMLMKQMVCAGANGSALTGGGGALAQQQALAAMLAGAGGKSELQQLLGAANPAALQAYQQQMFLQARMAALFGGLGEQGGLDAAMLQLALLRQHLDTSAGMSDELKKGIEELRTHITSVNKDEASTDHLLDRASKADIRRQKRTSHGQKFDLTKTASDDDGEGTSIYNDPDQEKVDPKNLSENERLDVKDDADAIKDAINDPHPFYGALRNYGLPDGTEEKDLKKVIMDRSDTQLQALHNEMLLDAKRFGQGGLWGAIDRETSGELKKTLLDRLEKAGIEKGDTTPFVADSKKAVEKDIDTIMHGQHPTDSLFSGIARGLHLWDGTDEGALRGVILQRSAEHLRSVHNQLLEDPMKYGRGGLWGAVERETSGDLKKELQDALQTAGIDSIKRARS